MRLGLLVCNTSLCQNSASDRLLCYDHLNASSSFHYTSLSTAAMVSGSSILVCFLLYAFQADGCRTDVDEVVTEKVKPQISQEEALFITNQHFRQSLPKEAKRRSSPAITKQPRRPWTPPEDAVYGKVVYSPDTRLKRNDERRARVPERLRKSGRAQLLELMHNTNKTNRKSSANFQSPSSSKPVDDGENLLRLWRSMPLNLMTWLRWREPELNSREFHAIPIVNNEVIDDTRTDAATEAPPKNGRQQRNGLVSTVTGRQFGGLDDLEMQLIAAPIAISRTTQTPEVEKHTTTKTTNRLTEAERLELHRRKKQELKRFLQQRVKQQITQRRTAV